MKILAVITIIFAFSSCESDYFDPKALEGEWEWLQSSGGIGGWTYKASPDDRMQLIFSRDGHYKAIKNGLTVDVARYKVKNGKSISFPESVPMIWFFRDSSSTSQSYHIKSDTLYLTSEVKDGFGSMYLRIK